MNELDKLYRDFAGNDRMLSIIERTKDIRQQCVDAGFQAEVMKIDGVPAVIITLANKFELEIAICERMLKPLEPQPFMPPFMANVTPLVYTDKIIGYEEILDGGCEWRLWRDTYELWINSEGTIRDMVKVAQVMKTSSETEEGIKQLEKVRTHGGIKLVVKTEH
jgi:hypothetical protein